MTPKAVATILNALPIDFSIRLRTAATHLSFTYMARVATLDARVANGLPTVSTLSATVLGTESISPVVSAWEPLWLANRAVAEAYGLGPDDFEHILSTFPVFGRKRPECFAYLLDRLAEWKEEAGTGGRRVPPARKAAPPLSRVAEPRPTDGRHRKSEP